MLKISPSYEYMYKVDNFIIIYMSQNPLKTESILIGIYTRIGIPARINCFLYGFNVLFDYIPTYAFIYLM